jgi:hypothetical protein
MAKGSRRKSAGLDPSGETEGIQDCGEPGSVHDPVQMGEGFCRVRGFSQPLNYIHPWKRPWIDRVRVILTGSPDRFESSASRLCGRLSLAVQAMSRPGHYDRAVEEVAIAAKEMRIVTMELERLAIELSDIRSQWIAANKEEPHGQDIQRRQG